MGIIACRVRIADPQEGKAMGLPTPDGRDLSVVDRVLQIAGDEDVAVLGIGPASTMAGEPSGFRPEDFLPGVQSLICFGIPLPRAVYRAPAYPLETVWRSQNLLYRRLDAIALRLCVALEESGARAIPVFGCMPLSVNDRGSVAGYVNQIRMAVAVGIGVVGNNGLLLHSRYGARLMLGGVLTTASLPQMRSPDSAEPGCPDDCRICSNACPVNAIMPESKQVRIMRCLNHTARTPSMSKLKFVLLRARDRKAAARYMSLTSFDEHTFHVCSKCVSLCPYGEPN
jgi:epoxyqueuosine reductase QueG